MIKRFKVDRMYFDLFIKGKMNPTIYAKFSSKIYSTKNIKSVQACGGLSFVQDIEGNLTLVKDQNLQGALNICKT